MSTMKFLFNIPKTRAEQNLLFLQIEEENFLTLVIQSDLLREALEELVKDDDEEETKLNKYSDSLGGWLIEAIDYEINSRLSFSEDDYLTAENEGESEKEETMKLLPKEAVEDLYNNPEKYIGDSEDEG